MSAKPAKPGLARPALREALERRVLLLDGAMGTQIHSANLELERDYLGHENCVDVISLTRPDVIGAIHTAYLEAGADAVETNTFGAMPHVLAEFGIEARCREINKAAAQVARAACAKLSTPARPRFALGSMGPGTKLATLGHMGYDALKASYKDQARGLVEGGVDGFLIETCQDPLQIKAALNAVLEARGEAELDLPVFVSVTMEVTGTMLVGTEMGAAIALLDPYPIDVLGINCATGPREMGEHVRLLGQTCRKRTLVYPNAGLPLLIDGQTSYPLTPEELADWLMRFVDEDAINMVGGCCGTTPAHIAAVARKLGVREPRPRKPAHVPSVTSNYAAVPLRQDNSILFVGERSNANGSRAFRDNLLKGDLDAMVATGREQVREGSHVLDLCTAYVGRDEVADMTGVIARYRTEVPSPLMIDSTEPPVLRAALALTGGRCIVNSINLEDGLERCEKVLPLVKEFGAAVVALTIDEQGMAKTAEDKLRIAKRIYRICTEDYGLAPEDLLFDVLTFTICTGNEDDRRLALETLEGIKRLREELPGVNLLLGVSNVSFGLNPAARHALNSVFLHHATEAGLTSAILHAARIEPLHRIDPRARQVAEDLIFDRRREGYDPLQEYLKLFEGVDVKKKAARVVPQDVLERLRWRIVEGERPGLEDDLKLALEKKKPLAIVNEDLLAGMAIVGELFGRGDMQLPFVLQSAETMKTAVAFLEPLMERAVGESRGRIVLATVRGDVHDIGKNLVDIILTNNGYTVVNIGIKQPVSAILDAAAEHAADVVGMSGLLVKSTVVMKENLQEMNARGVATGLPVLLGGAALTRAYVEQDLAEVYAGEVRYARDAFEGLRLMDALMGVKRGVPGATLPARRGARVRTARRPLETPEGERPARSDVAIDVSVPNPPFWGDRVVKGIPLADYAAMLDERATFMGQWGLRGARGGAGPSYEELVETEGRPRLRMWLERIAADRMLEAAVVYGYFPCVSKGDDLIVQSADGGRGERVRFSFPRQRRDRHLCLADFFRPEESGETDVVAFTVVTMGARISEVTAELFGRNAYRDYLELHGLSVQLTEALAEYWHRRIREELAIADTDSADLDDVLAHQGYRGSRYSFGYPACPDLEQQQQIVELIHPDRIGVQLSEEFQLHPEQSTSAIVVHHPEAKYFNAK